jgi:multidrug efflux system membrane fusion protein
MFSNSRTLMLLVACAGLAACSSDARVAPPARPAIVQQPTPAQTLATETYAGEIRARYESALGFRVPGKVQSRAVDVGARVKEGQVLATLEPQDAQLAVAAARAQVAWAEADLALAESELERHRAMLAKKFISQTLYDARVNAVKAAKARLDQARAQLSVNRNQADYTTLRADHDGVITQVNIEAGQVVAAGQPVMSLAHDGALEVLVAVPESRVALFHPGLRVLTEIWAQQNARYEGAVREVAPEADPRTRTYAVRVNLEDANAAIQLGMTARIYLNAGDSPSALVVPLAALGGKEGAPLVWKFDPKTRAVHAVPVTVGAYLEHGVLVTDGLAPDDWVVAAGVHKLTDAQIVRPVDAQNRPLAI